VVGAKYRTKRLPVDKLMDICKKLERPVLLLGNRSDQKRAEMVVMSVGEKVFNACGKCNINQSASFIRQADVVITHDTGLMHIAAAFQKEIISVWGNTVLEFGMYPYFGEGASTGKSHIIEVNGLSCRPCSKIGYNKCPKEHFYCMNKINVKRIVELAERASGQGDYGPASPCMD